MKPQNGIFLVFQKGHLRFYFSNFFYVQDQEEIGTNLVILFQLFLVPTQSTYVVSKEQRDLICFPIIFHLLRCQHCGLCTRIFLNFIAQTFFP